MPTLFLVVLLNTFRAPFQSPSKSSFLSAPPNSLWFNLLTIGSAQKKMITGKESVRAAGMVISYLVMGNKMTDAEVRSVKEIIRNARNNEDDSLPDMV